MDNVDQFPSLDRQINEARQLDGKHSEYDEKFGANDLMADEVNAARMDEENFAGKVNRAGKDYQDNFEKKVGRPVFERNEAGEVTGFDFGKGDDIYGKNTEVELPAETKEAADTSTDLVSEGIKKTEESRTTGGAIEEANKIVS